VRPPFAVIDTEVKATMALAGYTFDVRLDRVDALGEKGVAIVDYKTGNVVPPAKWFDARPQGAQLAIYAAAQAQRDGTQPVRALVYGRLKPGEIAPVGLADGAAAWPALQVPQGLRGVAIRDWNEAMSRLGSVTTALARACGAGDATVSPREPGVCGTCHLQAMCRVGTVDDEPVHTEHDDA
jgi:hypothetical protein